MPKTSSANLQIQWVYGKVQTIFGFLSEDLGRVLEIFEMPFMPAVVVMDDMTVISVTVDCRHRCNLLDAAGISYNYAEFRNAGSMTARQSGQVRYGHDGTLLHSNLVHDLQLMHLYDLYLRTSTGLDIAMRNRVCLVCCGQESWDNREENGQMHKMRNLLSQ